jgi:ligand-binding SRPBCC domain-containing protein
MIVLNTYRINAPLEQVAAFHRRSANMAAITPPPILVRMQTAPEELTDGDRMVFTVWFGPLPVHWRARIQNVSTHGFEDHQVEGPFREWTHSHRFRALDETTTEVTDEVHLQLKAKLPDLLIGLGMLLGMPILFTDRARRTRRLIEAAARKANAI